MDKKKTYNVKDCIFSKSISSLTLSFRANNFIRNNITRRLIIFGINKIDAGYCLLCDISALISLALIAFQNGFWKVKPKY